jgi:MoaA/NifB/PqqE/SkfB family radical SAM enzyme
MQPTTATIQPDVRAFDNSVTGFVRDAFKVTRGKHCSRRFFLKAAVQQSRAAKRRAEAARQGVPVPPFMIVSLTRSCNLRCKGCFVQAQHQAAGDEMSIERFRGLFAEACELGVSVIALAGGEPLTRPQILDVTKDFPEIIFPLITNGSLLTDSLLDTIQAQPNVIPVLSVEGYEGETDDRRGCGTFSKAVSAMEKMQARSIFFGASIMVTRSNFGLVISREFVRNLVRRGCRMFFYVDYVPIALGTEGLVPSTRQKRHESLAMQLLRAEFPAIFTASSTSEETFGGCMAAGKGFVHVSPSGNLEPCPFSPFSDTDVRRVPLRVALRSPFLRKIRESEEHLSESGGGCALWEKREWLEGLLKEDSAADGAGDAGLEQEGATREQELAAVAA